MILQPTNAEVARTVLLHSENIVVAPNQKDGQSHEASPRRDEQIEQVADANQTHERNQ